MKAKKKTKLVQLNFRISDKLLKQMDEYIDDIRFRSRGQILNIALVEWLVRIKRVKRREKMEKQNV